MTAEKAVKKITKYVRETQASAADATRKLWPDIQPIDDPEELIQFALAALVVREYKKPSMHETGDVIHVAYHPHRALKPYQVTVQVLEASYNVSGKVKAVLNMGYSDLKTLGREYAAAEQGFHRYSEFWLYAADRLKQLKKDRVSDLATGEQNKLARM